MSDYIPPTDEDSNSYSSTVIKITKNVLVGEGHVQVVDEKAIEKIFGRSDVKHCPVAIYSVAGSLRKGKSFFLNLVSRYLDFRVHNKEADWRKDTEAVLNQSFEWRGGSKGHTEGILVWSEPFWLSNDKHKKIAVFLMDTQGVFDDGGTKFSDSVMFCLTTFLSSYQIYNLSGTLNTSHLDYLKVFSDYGIQVYGQKLCETYQTLLFLIRDWGDLGFEFGFEGGDKYIKSKLDPKDGQSAEYESLCRNIKSSFKDVKCALLPHPGKKIAHRRDTDSSASIEDIDLDFLETAEQIFEQMFRSVEVKEFDGSPIRGEEVMNMAITFSNKVEENKFGADALIEAFSTASLGYLIERCENMFYRELETKISTREHKFITSNESLSREHKDIVKKVMDYFDREHKYGLNPMVSKCRTGLEDSLYRKKCITNNLNEVAKASIVALYHLLEEDCFEACLENFEEIYREDLDKEFFITSEDLGEKFMKVMHKTLELFQNVTNDFTIHEDTRRESLHDLQKKLNILLRIFKEENEIQEAILVVDALKLAHRAICGFVEKLRYVKRQDGVLLHSVLSEIKEEAMNYFYSYPSKFGLNTWWPKQIQTRLESTLSECATLYHRNRNTSKEQALKGIDEKLKREKKLIESFATALEMISSVKSTSDKPKPGARVMKRLGAMFSISVKDLQELKTSMDKLIGNAETSLISPENIVESWIKSQAVYNEVNVEWLQRKASHQRKLVVKHYNETMRWMLTGRKVTKLQMKMCFNESEKNFQSLAKTWPSGIANVETISYKHEMEASLSFWTVVNNFHKSIYVRKLQDVDITFKAIGNWFKSWFVETQVAKMRLATKPKEWSLDVKMGDYKPKFVNLNSVA